MLCYSILAPLLPKITFMETGAPLMKKNAKSDQLSFPYYTACITTSDSIWRDAELQLQLKEFKSLM